MRPPRRGVEIEDRAVVAGPTEPVLWDDVPEAPAGGSGRGEDRRAARPAASPDALFRMATHYLARYSTSTAHLRDVLARKIRRRCEIRDAPVPEADDLQALVDGVVARLARAGLIDDDAFGRGRAAALARKGWPAWRIKGELRRQGVEVEADGVAEAVDLDEEAQVRRFAQRKRLGPYRPGEREPYRDRDIRALARAGHPVDLAKRIIDGEAS